MTVKVDDQDFEGSGASKKLAKQACARMALTSLFNLSFTPMLFQPVDPNKPNPGGVSNPGGGFDKDEPEQLVPGKALIRKLSGKTF